MSTPRPKTAAPGRVVPEALTSLHNCCVGIDPGLDGGIAWIGDRLGVSGAMIAPTTRGKPRRRDFDRNAMVAILSRFNGEMFVAIEKVTAAPMRGRRQGTTSMFSFGKGYGLWLGMLQIMAIPYVEVDPRKWKRAILGGTPKDKAAAIGYARTFFPSVSLLATPRCRTFHDGLADALCLAEYARREWKTRQLLKGTNA